MLGRTVLMTLLLVAIIGLASAQLLITPVPPTPTPIPPTEGPPTQTPTATPIPTPRPEELELPFECILCASDEDCRFCELVWPVWPQTTPVQTLPPVIVTFGCYNFKRCPSGQYSCGEWDCSLNCNYSKIAQKCTCVKMDEYQGHKLPAGTGVCMAVPTTIPPVTPNIAPIPPPVVKNITIAVPKPPEVPLQTICIEGICKEVRPQEVIEIPRPPKPEVCPAVYKPVCGMDGKTYSNLCEAWRAEIPAACKGECPCTEILNLSIRHVIEVRPGEIIKTELEKELVLTVRPKEIVKTMQIIVSKIKEPPVKEKPPGLVYAYYEISTVSDEEVKTEGDVSFAVRKSWIVENRLNAENIRLARYNVTWEILKTEKISEDQEFVYYKAELPGFSYFAVIAEAPKPTPVQTPTPAPTPKPTPGFEAIFVIAGLFAVAYLLRRIKA